MPTESILSPSSSSSGESQVPDLSALSASGEVAVPDLASDSGSADNRSTMIGGDAVYLQESGDGLTGDPSTASTELPMPAEEPDPILHSSRSGEQAAVTVVPAEPPPAGSTDAFQGLVLDTPSTPHTAVSTPKDADDDEEFMGDEGPSRLPLLFLASYASAITLALLWVLFSGRTLFKSPDDLDVSDSRADSGRRAHLSKTVPKAVSLPAERITTLGKPLRVGDLEVTPIAVARGPVTLRSLTAHHEKRSGEPDALRLRLKLHNLSSTSLFAPLDESYLRDGDRGAPDSFLELGPTDRIYLYPLAVESEWAIVGQDFPTLNPGETAEAVVVSAPKVGDLGTEPILWRIRLRVDTNQTETIGVRFNPSNVGLMP